MSAAATPAPFGRRIAVVTSRERHGIYLVLHCADTDGPMPAPGQFYMLASAARWGGGEGERPFLPRAFSVLRARALPDGTPELQFLIDDVGPGTRRLSELGTGEELWLLGPLGSAFAPPREGRRPVLVGGGVGIAPLAILQDELEDEARVLLGFRNEEYAEAAALLPGAAVATDDGSTGHAGRVTELLADELARDADAIEVYACGPPAMLEAVRLLCAEHGAPAQLALESGMACGFGACFGCVVATTEGYVRLCLEGPVLDASRLQSAVVAGAPH